MGVVVRCSDAPEERPESVFGRNRRNGSLNVIRLFQSFISNLDNCSTILLLHSIRSPRWGFHDLPITSSPGVDHPGLYSTAVSRLWAIFWKSVAESFEINLRRLVFSRSIEGKEVARRCREGFSDHFLTCWAWLLRSFARFGRVDGTRCSSSLCRTTGVPRCRSSLSSRRLPVSWHCCGSRNCIRDSLSH